MRTVIITILMILALPLSADTKGDFVKWKEWVKKEIKVPENTGNAMVQIKLKDGREFAAEKKSNGDYKVKMQFGSFTVKKSEVKSVTEAEPKEKKFIDQLDQIKGFESSIEMTKLRMKYGTTKEILNAIDWWLLYLEPANHTLQDKFKISTLCKRCSGAGKIMDPKSPEITCPQCRGAGMLKCRSCRGAGVYMCPTCKGTGEYTAIGTRSSNPGAPSTAGQEPRVCPKCKGKREYVCGKCKGEPKKACPTCKGNKKIRKPVLCPGCSGRKSILLPASRIHYPFLGGLKEPENTEKPKEKKTE